MTKHFQAHGKSERRPFLCWVPCGFHVINRLELRQYTAITIAGYWLTLMFALQAADGTQVRLLAYQKRESGRNLDAFNWGNHQGL